MNEERRPASLKYMELFLTPEVNVEVLVQAVHQEKSFCIFLIPSEPDKICVSSEAKLFSFVGKSLKIENNFQYFSITIIP